MMSRLAAGAVKAFSIGFEEHEFNELGYAEISAKSFQADHYTYLVSAADCRQALPQMVQGQLIADTVACIGTIDIVLGEVDR